MQTSKAEKFRASLARLFEMYNQGDQVPSAEDSKKRKLSEVSTAQEELKLDDGKKKIFKMNPPEINLLELSEKDLAVKVREVLGVVKGFDV